MTDGEKVAEALHNLIIANNRAISGERGNIVDDAKKTLAAICDEIFKKQQA